MILNPILIVEVLSPSTALHDREAKFLAYKAIPSFKEYLLIAQDAIHISHYTRQADEGWIREDITDIGASLTLELNGCSLLLTEIYEGITFNSV